MHAGSQSDKDERIQVPKELGIKKHIKGAATLGEIYAMRVNSGTLLHDVDEAKGLPPEIEDLL